MFRDDLTVSKLLGFTLDGDRVTKLSPKGNLEWSRHRGATPMDGVGHEAFADEIVDAGLRVTSVLVFTSPMRPDLFDDPRHAKVSVEVCESEVESDVYRHFRRTLPLSEDALKELRDLGVDVDGALNSAETSGESRSAVMDHMLGGFYRALGARHYAEILAAKRVDFRTHDPLTGKRRRQPLKGDDLREAWKREELRLLSPQTMRRYERISPLAEPFNGLSFWQQYFLVGDGQGRGVELAFGSSDGSSTRFSQGFHAHAFALLQDRAYLGLEGTLVVLVGEDNQARLLASYAGFKTTSHDLRGNYPSSEDDVRRLFYGKIVTYDRDVGLSEGSG